MPCRSALLLALIASVPAAELAVRDVRLGIATRPADFDFTVTTPLVSGSGSDAFDGGLSVEGGLRWSFARTGDAFGLIAGADLAMDGQGYEDGDGLATMWAKAAGGFGWAVNDQLTLMAEGLIGYGLSDLSLPATSSAAAYTADGTATAYEARVTGTWQFTRDFNAGLMVGWLVADHDLSGDDSELTIEQSGWYAGVVFAWRINDLPLPLE